MARRSSKSTGARRGRSARRSDEAAVVSEAKVFTNGRSQAVRLPASYRFTGDSVYVKRWRGAVILLPKGEAWAPLVESLGGFSDDFMKERPQPAEQRRPGLDGLFD
ncbi:MAG TPA: type II toxin-antitoxin system VapB family antitoxin [Gemmatimonadaceae bacterium]|nr:type II toxin-antitoxin system VapB family antitoxin [Gemmatimonadaceae bacterium]